MPGNGNDLYPFCIWAPFFYFILTGGGLVFLCIADAFTRELLVRALAAPPFEAMDERQGQAWNYVVSAQKPTNVTHALVGHLVSPQELNLIVCKCTRIEIHIVDENGLRLAEKGDIPLYGRVATMELWRPQSSSVDHIFISTERHQFCILAIDPTTRELITKAKGDVSDRTGRPSNCGQICAMDPANRLIGLHLYDGLFKVLPATPSGHLNEAYNVRLEELQVPFFPYVATPFLPYVKGIMVCFQPPSPHLAPPSPTYHHLPPPSPT